LDIAANVSAGFGDTLTSGFGLTHLFGVPSLTEWIRSEWTEKVWGGVDAVNPCSTSYKVGKYSGYGWAAITGGAIAVRALQIEINLLSRGNVFKIISRRLKMGFRIDPAHHGKRWGHPHLWRW